MKRVVRVILHEQQMTPELLGLIEALSLLPAPLQVHRLALDEGACFDIHVPDDQMGQKLIDSLDPRCVNAVLAPEWPKE